MLATMPPTGPRITLRSHVDTYLNRLDGHLALSSLRNHEVTLRRFAAWWDSTRKVPLSLREQDVEKFVWGPHECAPGCRGRVHRGAGLRSTYGKASLRQALNHMSGFLEWAVRYRLVKPEVLEPVARHRYPRIPHSTRRRRLDVGQLAELLDGCPDPWERVVCALAIHTAGRSGELVTLRLGDVDLDAGEIDWSRHKTGQVDYLPITADLDVELHRWLKEYERLCGPLPSDAYLVPRRTVSGPGGPRYHPDLPRGGGYARVVKKHLARVLGVDEAELCGEGVHTVRRSVARCLYEQLCEDHHPDPIAVVQALLGHSSRVMTERYIGVESGRRERDKALRGRSVLRRA